MSITVATNIFRPSWRDADRSQSQSVKKTVKRNKPYFGRFRGGGHGWQDAELGRGAWTLSDAVSGSVGPQGAATNVSSLRVGADRSWRSQEHSADGGPACGW